MPDLTERSGPKYAALATAIREAVSQEVLAPGVRLPPVRDLAYRLGITPGTVARAYSLMTEEGVLRGETGRGTFVASRQEIVDPPFLVSEARPRAINLRSSVVPEVGQSAAVQDVLKGIGGDDLALLDYPQRRDDGPAADAFLAWISKIEHGPATAQDVVLSQGAQHGVLIALQTLVGGARRVVFTEELAYPGFRHAAALAGALVVGVPMDREGPDPAALAALCRKHGPAVLCTSAEAHNPTTVFTTPRRRAEIVEVARRFDLHIIDDDCFSVGQPQAPTYRALAPERGWYVASFSKSFSPALRFGGVVAPTGWAPRAVATAQQQIMGLSRLVVVLCQRLMESGQVDLMRDRVRQATAGRVALAREILGASAAGEGIAARDGVPFLWMSMPRGWRASSFERAAEERGILLRPADLFALVDGRAPNAVRLALNASMAQEVYVGALETLASLLNHPPSEVEV